MDSFPSGGTISSMLNPPQVNAACGRWPGVFWRRSALAMHHCRSVPALQLSVLSRLIHQRSLSHSRASNHRLAGRAAECGQGASRRCPLPTVQSRSPAFRRAQVAAL